MENYTIRRSLSLELPAHDWSGTCTRSNVWVYADKSVAEMAKLHALLAKNKLEFEKRRATERELRARCLIDIAEYTMQLQRSSAHESEVYENEIAAAEHNEIKILLRLKECLKELKETKRTLRYLKAERMRDAESGRDGEFESTSDTGAEGGRRVRNEGSGEGDTESISESGSEGEGVTDDTLEVNMIVDRTSNETGCDTEERGGNQRGVNNGVFASIRRMFRSCRRQRLRRGSDCEFTDRPTSF